MLQLGQCCSSGFQQKEVHRKYFYDFHNRSECPCFKKEVVESVYENTYNLSNQAMNLLRKVILLNDTRLLAKVINIK